MFVMKPDTFDAYFEVCTDEKEQFIPPLVYDASMRFMNNIIRTKLNILLLFLFLAKRYNLLKFACLEIEKVTRLFLSLFFLYKS